MDIVSGFDTWVVVDMLGTLQRGLANALQHKILIQCAKAIDYFGSFLFRHKHRSTPIAIKMRQHLQQVPSLVTEMVALLVKQILTDEHTDVGIMSHPLLSLILADGAAFETVCSSFVSRQRPGVHPPIHTEAFACSSFVRRQRPGVHPPIHSEAFALFLES